jgi:predicted secreted acid phosphatase
MTQKVEMKLSTYAQKLPQTWEQWTNGAIQAQIQGHLVLFIKYVNDIPLGITYQNK